jgi:hypothetical protein
LPPVGDPSSASRLSRCPLRDGFGGAQPAAGWRSASCGPRQGPMTDAITRASRSQPHAHANVRWPSLARKIVHCRATTVPDPFSTQTAPQDHPADDRLHLAGTAGRRECVAGRRATHRSRLAEPWQFRSVKASGDSSATSHVQLDVACAAKDRNQPAEC